MPFREQSLRDQPVAQMSIAVMVMAMKTVNSALADRLASGRPLTIEEQAIVTAFYVEQTELTRNVFGLGMSNNGEVAEHFSFKAFSVMPKLARNRDMKRYWKRFALLLRVVGRDVRSLASCHWRDGRYREIASCCSTALSGIALLALGGVRAALGFRKADIEGALRMIHRAINVQVIPQLAVDLYS